MRNIKEVAASMLKSDNLDIVLSKEESSHGDSGRHAKWMLERIAVGEIAGDKAQRWLGYAQGMLVAKGYFTLQNMKDFNK